MTGRTACDRIVVFNGNRRQAGRLLPVVVEEVDAPSPSSAGSSPSELVPTPTLRPRQEAATS